MTTVFSGAQIKFIKVLIEFLKTRQYSYLGGYNIVYIQGCMVAALELNCYNDYQKKMFNCVRDEYIKLKLGKII